MGLGGVGPSGMGWGHLKEHVDDGTLLAPSPRDDPALQQHLARSLLAVGATQLPNSQ